ncbi:hypothetical protein [Actinocatenispora rupis]|uniref:YbaB/EbfC DNA-binding family protein n=1 Tax=Actinocatenispora rupis TaxID=519421 RepID=A0A8J3J4J6_9ACTN|nr:hypothetical protein [Actinocatenispora rupis]GID10014.1 hypothetical protein Aru02nite_09030 [Actinocatenispora rupis]
MAFDTEARRAALAAARARVAELTDATSPSVEYEGVDPEGIARARIDGAGAVRSLELDPVVARVPDEMVGAAVVAAIDAADALRVDAIGDRLDGESS